MRKLCFMALTLLVFAIFASRTPAQGNRGNDQKNTAYRRKIESFSVGLPDIPLTYPSYFAGLDLPDEHTTLLPIWSFGAPWSDYDRQSYLLFSTSSVTSGGPAGAVVLETTDLTNFYPATSRGYAEQVMSSPVSFTDCDGTHDQEFDENYAGPGSVLQDPTLPPGNLIMLYEAENHCPGGKNQTDFYATTGFARSFDGGRTWPQPVNSEFGDLLRHPVLKISVPEPTMSFSPGLGDAIPSGFVDVNANGEANLYVTYSYHDGSTGSSAISIRVARAKLGEIREQFGRGRDFDEHDGPQNVSIPQPQFYKWYNGAFSQPGMGGLDSAVLTSTSCIGQTRMSELTFNDDLELYMLIFVCSPSAVSNGQTLAAWYYSTATSLDLQDWSTPQPIANSQTPYTSCTDKSGIGSVFDGFNPSFMSPGAPAGHTRLTGRAFFLDGCDHSPQRVLGSRTFTISLQP